MSLLSHRRLWILPLTFLLTSPVLAAFPERVDDGGFEAAGDLVYTNDQVTFFSAWRYFSLSTSDARLETTSDAHSGSKALHLWRYNTTADVGGVDKDYPGLRIFVEPGHTYRISVWAKSPSNSQFRIRIPEFDSSGSYLGIDHGGSHPLTGTYQEYVETYTAQSGAASVSVAIVLDAPGEVVFDDVSFREIATAVPPPPTISLPTGIATSRRPRIEWRGQDHDAFHVRIGRTLSPVSMIVWDSGATNGSQSRIDAPAIDLPTDETLYVHVRERNAFGWGAWNTRTAPFRIELPPQPSGTLYTFDLDDSRSLSPSGAFENAHLVSALQGIVNRDGPRLFVYFVKEVIRTGDVDRYWLNRLREPDRWLEDVTLQPVASIESLVQTFRDDIQGVVVWDPAVESTSNVASTVAGVENLLPIPYDTDAASLYQRLVVGGPQLPVVVNLVGKFTGTGTIPDTTRPSSGSRKCDAYLWAVDRYIKTGLCNPAFQGYYIDAYWIDHPGFGGDIQNHTLTNHDFFIAHRGFFWDLNVWGDEKPIDDPSQPFGTDLNTVKEILLSSYNALDGNSMIHIGGFTPWAFKYTNQPDAGGTHGAVDTEWEMVRVLSAYNAYIDADALSLSALANASLYRHLPLPDRFTQPLPPMPDELRYRGWLDPDGHVQAKSYLYHYVGDYDSAAWVSNTLFPFWDSPTRGQVRLTWAISPTNALRARPFFDYAYRTRTALDTFAAGSSGAGYVNPTQLLPPRNPSGLPSAASVFASHGRNFYRQFDYDFTGFIINGRAGANTTAGQRLYLPFSGGGIVDLNYNAVPPTLVDTMPAFRHGGDLNGSYFGGIFGTTPGDDAATIANSAHVGVSEFLMFRTVISTPEYYRDVNNWLDTNRPHLGWVFCDSDTLSYLARQFLGGQNDFLASYLFDTIPATLTHGTTQNVEIAIRNDGWESWEAEGANATALVLNFLNDGVSQQTITQPLPTDVPPGDSIVLDVALFPTVEAGDYQLRYEMIRSGQRFSERNDIPWESPVVVEPLINGLDGWMLY